MQPIKRIYAARRGAVALAVSLLVLGLAVPLRGQIEPRLRQTDLKAELDAAIQAADSQRNEAIASLRRITSEKDIPAAAKKAEEYAAAFVEINVDADTAGEAKGIFARLLTLQQDLQTKENRLQKALETGNSDSLREAYTAGLNAVRVSKEKLKATRQQFVVLRGQMVRFRDFAKDVPEAYAQLADFGPEEAEEAIGKAVEKELAAIGPAPASITKAAEPVRTGTVENTPTPGHGENPPARATIPTFPVSKAPAPATTGLAEVNKPREASYTAPKAPPTTITRSYEANKSSTPTYPAGKAPIRSTEVKEPTREDPPAEPISEHAQRFAAAAQQVIDETGPAYTRDNWDAPPHRSISVLGARYPREMRRQGIEGTVRLAVWIDGNGSVRNWKLLNSSRVEFEEAAIEAVRGWKYSPGRKGGQAVATIIEETIPFTRNW